VPGNPPGAFAARKGELVDVDIRGEVTSHCGGHDLNRKRDLEHVEGGGGYVFVRNSSGSWILKDKLIASDGMRLDQFGCSVSLSGKTALVGAQLSDDYKGAAYVFVGH
jgi:hypothetical protein